MKISKTVCHNKIDINSKKTKPFAYMPKCDADFSFKSIDWGYQPSIAASFQSPFKLLEVSIAKLV